MEIWLTSDDRDMVRVKASELNITVIRLIAVNRIKGRGSGLAIVYNADFDVKLLSSSKGNTVQFAI